MDHLCGIVLYFVNPVKFCREILTLFTFTMWIWSAGFERKYGVVIIADYL